NQIWFNRACTTSLLGLLKALNSVPFNQAGYEAIKAALQDPINAALNNGVIHTGVPLSATEASAVNAAAGASVSNIITQQGYYLQVVAPLASVRAARGSPTINLWYTDGESIQVIDMTSVLIQ